MTTQAMRTFPAAARTYLGRDILTTGQVAALCGVGCRTAAKWIDAGMIPGWRLPGSPDRRVYRADLLRFARTHGLRVKGAATRSVGCLMPASEGLDVVSPVALGAMAADGELAAVVFGCGYGLDTAVRLAREVRELDPTVRLTLTLADDRTPADVPAGVFDAVAGGHP